MKFEIDLDLLKKVKDLTLNQLVLLSSVLNNSIKLPYDFISLIDKSEAQDLVSRELLTISYKTKNKKTYIVYTETPLLLELLQLDKNPFDEFYDLYPSYITRPDGTKDYLRVNKKNCEKFYKSLVKNDINYHKHILNCLSFYVSQKVMTGKEGYMKNMWKWLTQREWETIESQMKDSKEQIVEQYGTKLY